MAGRDRRSQQPGWTDFEAAVDRWAKTGLAGALLMSPIALGAATGVPKPIMLVYFAFALVAYIVLVLRSYRRKP